MPKPPAPSPKPPAHSARNLAALTASAKARATEARTRYLQWASVNDSVYLAWRRPGPAEITAGAIGLLLIVAAIMFLIVFDWNWLRGPIGRWASDHYERDIRINGDLDMRLFSWTPSASVEGLYVGGPAWAADRPTAEVERIEASVRLRKLFIGQIEMPRLAFTRPHAVLIVDEDGRESWALGSQQSSGDGDLPAIQRLLIEGGELDFTDRRRGITLQATLTASEVVQGQEGADQAGFRLEGEGALNGQPLRLQVNGGPLIYVRRDRPYAFDAELSGARSTLSAEGTITRPFDLRRFDAELTLRGEDLADLYLITTVPTPNSPPYQLSGALVRRGDRFEFNDFSGRVGSSDLSGDLAVFKAGDRRRVEADLTSRSLDIDDLAAVLGARPQVTGQGNTVATSGAPGRLLPDAPLQTERLRSIDGRLTYRAQSVKRNSFEIRQVDLGAVLEGGVLNLDPVSFNFNQGELNGTARIDARQDTPHSALDFRLAGYPLESIVPARNGAPTISGRTLGRLRIEGPGASIHDLASNATGSASLVVPQGEMRAAFAELLGINVGRGLRLLLSGDRSSTPIRCAVADFDIRSGTAAARTLVIDTEVVLAQGSGTIDLESETMNLRIDGETKQPRLLRVWAPITVSGPMVQPRLGVDGAAVAGQVGVVGALSALVSPVAALLGFVDPGLAEDANCGALIASAR